MTKLSDIKPQGKFLLNGNSYYVKEVQKDGKVLIVRLGDNHLFVLDKSTEVDEYK